MPGISITVTLSCTCIVTRESLQSVLCFFLCFCFCMCSCLLVLFLYYTNTYTFWKFLSIKHDYVKCVSSAK